MAQEITNTEASVVIPELWRPLMLKARYAAQVIGKRVLSVDGDVAKAGDSLHIPIEPTVTMNAVGSNGSVTNQALTPTEQQLTVDKWYEATIDVVDKAQRQSLIDLLKGFLPGFGKASAAKIDEELAALITTANFTTNSVGATAAPFDTINPDIATAAIQKLLDLNVPVESPNEISWFFHTSLWSQLKKIADFNNANLTGQSKGGMLEMKVPDLYGIPVYFSTQIVSAAGTRRNLLAHREALAWGMQKNFRVETLARVRKSTPVSGDVLFGVKVVRENHACLVHTAA